MHRAAARCQENFYPRPPRGGRRPPSRIWRWSWSFLSTPSARRATRIQTYFGGYYYISIHALREEGDAPFPGPGCSRSSNFYPRPPRGGRPPPPLCGLVGVKISIHALREEGDVSPYRGDQQHAISIHALREEGDVMEMQPAFWQLLFLSTPSARRATEVCGADRRICEISIHALREEGDSFPLSCL